MARNSLAIVAATGFFCAPAIAAQSLNVPESPTFSDRLPKKEKSGESYEFSMDKTITLERDEPPIVLCSELVSEQKDMEAALDACNKAVAAKPEKADGYYYRGFALYCLDRLEEAEADFTTVIGLGASRLAESYYQRGVCKEKQRRLREASVDFKAARALKPDWFAAKRKVEEYQ